VLIGINPNSAFAAHAHPIINRVRINDFRAIFKNNTRAELNFPENQHEKRFFRGFQPGDNIGAVNLSIPTATYTAANGLTKNIFDSVPEILGDTKGDIAKITATPATCDLKYKQNQLTKTCFDI